MRDSSLASNVGRSWIDGISHWRSISKDNVTTFYGKTPESRITDPNEPTKIFSWLICETYDDKGNAILYSYKEEDDAGIDLSQANERNRSTENRRTSRYIKSIRYGNTRSHVDPAFASREAWRAATEWLFEVIFDYGDGHFQEQSPDADGRIFVRTRLTPPLNSVWPPRLDPFSSYRAAFEVRTYRLCRRVLMYHHFEAELGTPDYLVQSTEFDYNETPIASFITGVTQSGYVRGTGNRYRKKSCRHFNFSTVKPGLKRLFAKLTPKVWRTYRMVWMARTTSGQISMERASPAY